MAKPTTYMEEYTKISSNLDPVDRLIKLARLYNDIVDGRYKRDGSWKEAQNSITITVPRTVNELLDRKPASVIPKSLKIENLRKAFLDNPSLESMVTVAIQLFKNNSYDATINLLKKALNVSGAPEDEATAITELIALLLQDDDTENKIKQALMHVTDKNSTEVAKESLRLANDLLQKDISVAQCLFTEHIQAGGKITAEQCTTFNLTNTHLEAILTATTRIAAPSLHALAQYAEDQSDAANTKAESNNTFVVANILALATSHYLSYEEQKKSAPEKADQDLTTAQQHADKIAASSNKENRTTAINILNGLLNYYNNAENRPEGSHITSFLYLLKVRIALYITVNDCEKYSLQTAHITKLLANETGTENLSQKRLLHLQEYLLSLKTESPGKEMLLQTVDALLLVTSKETNTTDKYLELRNSCRKDQPQAKNRWNSKLLNDISDATEVTKPEDYAAIKASKQKMQQLVIDLAKKIVGTDGETTRASLTTSLCNLITHYYNEAQKEQTKYDKHTKNSTLYLYPLNKDFTESFLSPVISVLLRSQQTPWDSFNKIVETANSLEHIANELLYASCITELVLQPEVQSPNKTQQSIAKIGKACPDVSLLSLSHPKFVSDSFITNYKAAICFLQWKEGKKSKNITNNEADKITSALFVTGQKIAPEAFKFLAKYVYILSNNELQRVSTIALKSTPWLALKLLLTTQNNRTKKLKPSKTHTLALTAITMLAEGELNKEFKEKKDAIKWPEKNKNNNQKYIYETLPQQIATELNVPQKTIADPSAIAPYLREQNRYSDLKNMYINDIMSLPTTEDELALCITDSQSESIGVDVISTWLQRGATSSPGWLKKHGEQTVNALRQNNSQTWTDTIAALNPEDKQHSATASSAQSSTTTTVTTQLNDDSDSSSQQSELPNTEQDIANIYTNYATLLIVINANSADVNNQRAKHCIDTVLQQANTMYAAFKNALGLENDGAQDQTDKLATEINNIAYILQNNNAKTATDILNHLYKHDLIPFPETEAEIRQCLEDYINGADNVFEFLYGTNPTFFGNTDLWEDLLREYAATTLQKNKPHYEELLRLLAHNFGRNNHLAPHIMAEIRQRAGEPTSNTDPYPFMLLETYVKEIAALPETAKELTELFTSYEFTKNPNIVFSFLKASATEMQNSWNDQEQLDDTLWQLYNEHREIQLLFVLAIIKPQYENAQKHIKELRQQLTELAEQEAPPIGEEHTFWDLYYYNAIPLPSNLEELAQCLADYALEIKRDHQPPITYQYLKAFFSEPSAARTQLLTNINNDEIEDLFAKQMDLQPNNALAYINLLKLLKPEWWPQKQQTAAKFRFLRGSDKGKGKCNNETDRGKYLETTAKNLQANNSRVTEKNKSLENESETKEEKFTNTDTRPEEFKMLDGKKNKPPYVLCSISYRVMYDPVLLKTDGDDAQLYDFEVIKAWINKNGTHPVTRAPITVEDLDFDLNLRPLIDGWAQRNGVTVDRTQQTSHIETTTDSADPKPSAPEFDLEPSAPPEELDNIAANSNTGEPKSDHENSSGTESKADDEDNIKNSAETGNEPDSKRQEHAVPYLT